ncbi:MAG: hypothetical protein IPO27_09850 [Bacteroidetes bacterium]|nr:hypothetical protein [Bacteroidota bacterium]
MLISIRNFFAERKKIKQELPSAWVIPMFPKMSSWRLNRFTLLFICLLTGERVIIARNVLAAHIALALRKWGIVKKVCYDGRGAMTAEWNEYKVVPSIDISRDIVQLEADAVIKSNFRIAVSNHLVIYWKNTFNYADQNHVVIPCTLNSGFRKLEITTEKIKAARNHLNFADDECILVYSGSTSGWQSFYLISDFLKQLFSVSKKYQVVFLSESNKEIEKLISEFPDLVTQRWLPHKQVQKVLMACDYGVMIRENSITNRVASPTKFAEYLSAGLKILTSDNLGDYTEFVMEHKCGMVVNSKEAIRLSPLSTADRTENIKLTDAFFTKQAQMMNYKKLIDNLK